jgi:rubrerythrin
MKVDALKIYSNEELKMLTKENLINELKEALKTEESAIPLYTKHVSNTLFLADMEEEEVSKIKEILATLNSDSRKHARIYKSLINRVEGGAKDVY